MITIEAESGRILYENNAYEKRPMASTTKILTAITVIENTDIKQRVKVDDKAVGIEGSSIYLQHGEQLKVIDLLHGLMLQSGNDCAVALAIYTAGSVEKFADMMNGLAKRIGANNSNFTNPHGLHDDKHYTTAYDLAKISAYAMKNEIFRKIVSTKTYTIPYQNHEYNRVIKNKNKIIFNFNGGNGIKTGYTKKAGRCLVASANRNNMTVITVVLNCPSMFEECSFLMEKAFSEYDLTTIVNKNEEITKAYVKNGKEKYLPLYCKNKIQYPLKQNEKELLEVKLDIYELTAPIKKEKICGKVYVTLNNQLLFEEFLYNIYSVDSESIIDNFIDILDNWSN